jgi:hypothetical protein
MVWSTKVNCPINIVKYNEPNDVGLEPKGEQSDNLLNFGVTFALPGGIDRSCTLTLITHAGLTET